MCDLHLFPKIIFNNVICDTDNNIGGLSGEEEEEWFDNNGRV